MARFVPAARQHKACLQCCFACRRVGLPLGIGTARKCSLPRKSFFWQGLLEFKPTFWALAVPPGAPFALTHGRPTAPCPGQPRLTQTRGGGARPAPCEVGDILQSADAPDSEPGDFSLLPEANAAAAAASPGRRARESQGGLHGATIASTPSLRQRTATAATCRRGARAQAASRPP